MDIRNVIKKLAVGSIEDKKITKVSTGLLGLDLMLYGGFAYGSIHELYGLSKTGKSLIGLLTIKQAHLSDPNAIGVILDGENAHKNINRIKSLGLDLSRLIIIPKKLIPTISDCYKKILELLCSIELAYRIQKDAKEYKLSDVVEGIGRKIRKDSPPIIFFVDSVPSFPEKTDLVEDMGKRAKYWHAVLRRLTGILDEKTMILLSNHVIYKPETYGNPESKTSGIAIDYYRDDGVKLNNIGTILGKDSKNVIGYWIQAEVEKSRDGVMHSKTFFPVFFRKTPIHKYAGVLALAYYCGLVKLNNKTAWEKRKKESDVFPNFVYDKKVYSEFNYKSIEELVDKSDLVDKIKSKLLFFD